MYTISFLVPKAKLLAYIKEVASIGVFIMNNLDKQKMLKALKGAKASVVIFANGCKATHMGSTWYFWYQNSQGSKVVDFIPT
jgi:hypothetical protein